MEQLQPTDLVVLMDPLTTLDSLRYTRDKQQLLERVQKFEGRRGELFPVRSAVEEAQMTQRNVWELRAGVSLSALEAIITHFGGIREGRKSVLFVSQGPPVGMPGSVNYPGSRQRSRPPTAATSRCTCSIRGRSARLRSAAPRPCGGCRPKQGDGRSSTPTIPRRVEGRHRRRERVLPDRLRADTAAVGRQVPPDQRARQAIGRAGLGTPRLLGADRSRDQPRARAPARSQPDRRAPRADHAGRPGPQADRHVGRHRALRLRLVQGARLLGGREPIRPIRRRPWKWSR